MTSWLKRTFPQLLGGKIMIEKDSRTLGPNEMAELIMWVKSWTVNNQMITSWMNFPKLKNWWVNDILIWNFHPVSCLVGRTSPCSILWQELEPSLLPKGLWQDTCISYKVCVWTFTGLSVKGVEGRYIYRGEEGNRWHKWKQITDLIIWTDVYKSKNEHI